MESLIPFSVIGYDNVYDEVSYRLCCCFFKRYLTFIGLVECDWNVCNFRRGRRRCSITKAFGHATSLKRDFNANVFL